MKYRTATLALCAACVLAFVPRTQADIIDDWNNAALDAIRLSRTAPPVATRQLAILHAAIFDAANGIARKYEPFMVTGKVLPAAHMETAIAAAGHTALTALFTNEASRATFDQLLVRTMAGKGKKQPRKWAYSWGKHVANTILQSRSTDGWNTPAPYTGDVTVPGVWRPTISFGGIVRPALLPGWGNVRPFVMTTGNQFRPEPPPALDSAQYAAELNEVKAYGAATGSSRTEDQTEIANFWANGAGTATPPGHWNVIAQIVSGHVPLIDKALLFATLNAALADAAISCWDCKYSFNLWRPITAVREADTDGNDATDPDPSWTPLLETPPFPEYTSGHSTFSGAAAAVLATFFGTDEISFTVGSDFIEETRTFTSFSHAAEESAWSRLYGGIHFTSGNFRGLASGYALGQHCAERMFRLRENRAPF